MDHFISVIFAKQLNESKRDIVLDTMINTARVGLTEDSVEYELFESEDSSTVLRLPLAKPIKEAHQQAFVEALANRLFDKGHTDFEIELSVLNENLLRQGSRGADVKALQAQLGMPAAEQDGIFGPKTERAVRTFQQSMGLQVDGIVGPQTRTAIANSQAAGAATRDTPYNPQAVPQTPTQQRAAANPQTAAPQTSPRPQARPAQTTAAPTELTPDQRDARNQDQGSWTRAIDATGARIEPGTTAGGPSRLRQRQMAQANPDATDPRGPDQRNVPSTPRTGATASGVQGDGLRGPGATPEPLGSGNLPTGPGGDQALDTARTGTTTSGVTAQTDVTTPTTGATASGEQGDGLRGTATADTGQNLVSPTLTAPQVSDTAPNIDTTAITAPSVNTNAGAGLGQNDTGSDTVNFTGGGGEQPVNVNRNAPTLGGPGDAEELPQTQDNAANRDAQVIAQQQADFRARYNDDTTGRDGLPTEFVTQALDPALDTLSSQTAQNLADAAADAPAPVARIIKRDIERTYGSAEELMDMAREVEAEDVDQSRALEILSNLYTSLNMTDARDNIADQNARFNDSVEPRPKGAFMFRERNEWDALYSRTHNRDGSLKAKTNLIESRKYDEVTYHDDDQFYEDYGVMWYNEDEVVDEAEYRGRKVKLGKPMKGDVKKFKVYVRNPKGNVVKVNFGQKGVKIKKSNPARRRSFRARHNCDNPGPRHKARYWSCRKW